MNENAINRPKKFSWLKRVGWSALALVSLILITLLLLRFLATTGLGHSFVEKRIEAAAPSGQSVQIDGLTGDLLGDFTVQSLTVSDAEGIWLTAKNAHIDWRPLALSRRRLFIRDLVAYEVTMTRRPLIVSSDEPDTEDNDPPVQRATLDNLSLKHVTLSGDVTPQPVDISVNGQAQVSTKTGKLKIDVVPADTNGDRLRADLSWSEARPLNGSLDLTAPAGGLFASLARLDPDQNLTATLKASGSQEAWRARATAYINDNPAIRFETTGAADTISFSGQANPNLHPLTNQFSDWLGSTIITDGTINLNDDTRIIDATLTGAHQTLRTTAELSQDNTLTADIRLEADDLDKLQTDPPYTFSALILDGVLTQNSEELSFSGTADASALSFGDTRIQRLSGPINVTREDDDTRLEADLSGEGVSVAASADSLIGRSPALKMDLNYAGEANALSVNAASLTSPNLQISTSGRVGFSESISADISGALKIDREANADLRPIQTKATWNARTQTNGNIVFSVDGTAAELGDLPAPLDQWIAGPTTYALNGARTPAGAINVPNIKLTSTQLNVNGSAARQPTGELSMKATASAGAAKIGPATVPSLTANFSANGPSDNIVFSGRANTPHLTAGDARLRAVALSLNGRYASGAISSAIDLSAESTHGPLTAASNITLSDGLWQTSDTQMKWGGLTATADISGDGGDLSALRGRMVAKGTLPDFIPAAAIDFTGELQSETLVARLTLDDLTIGPVRDTAVALNLNGTTAQASYTLAIDGTSIISDLERPLEARLSGSLSDVLTDQRRTESDANIILGKVELTSRTPISLAQSPRGLEADADLNVFGGQLKLRLSDEATERLVLNLSGLALSEILTFTGRSAVSGELNGTARLQDAGPHLTGSFTGDLTNLQQSSGATSPVTVSMKGRLDNERLTVDLITDDTSGLAGKANLTLPVTTSSTPLSLSPVPDTAINFLADIDGDISGIASVIAPPEMVASGQVALDIAGSLPLSRGDSQGNFTLEDGRFEHGDAGIVMQDINLASTISSGAVTLDRFNALGRDGGALTGNGVLHFANAGASTLTLTADKLVVFKRKEGRATASGNLNLDYTEDLLSLAGDLNINDARINLDALPKGGEPTLDVVFRDPAATEPVEKEPRRATKLDITIKSKRGIELRGQGVDADAGLDATLTGSFSDPIIVGTASIVRGRFNLLGKRFVFQDSTVKVNGDPMTAALDITAAREADDITAIVRVSGTPRRPQIDLKAQPEVPEDEVLSRVLFGRSPSELSALEAARLASALTQLSGGKGFDLMGGLEDSLGLDALALGQSEAGDFEVTTGKYIASDVYVELTSSSEGTPGVALEWEPFSNVTVGAETIPGEGQDVTIKWKRDFD